jgi:hypothetical protein
MMQIEILLYRRCSSLHDTTCIRLLKCVQSIATAFEPPVAILLLDVVDSLANSACTLTFVGFFEAQLCQYQSSQSSFHRQCRGGADDCSGILSWCYHSSVVVFNCCASALERVSMGLECRRV